MRTFLFLSMVFDKWHQITQHKNTSSKRIGLKTTTEKEEEGEEKNSKNGIESQRVMKRDQKKYIKSPREFNWIHKVSVATLAKEPAYGIVVVSFGWFHLSFGLSLTLHPESRSSL